MVFTIKGQTKAAATFKGISAIYRPILFNFGMQVAYRHLCLVYFMVFIIKGLTKATATFKGISAIYRPILCKFGMQIAYRHLYLVYFMVLTIKGRIHRWPRYL